MTQLERVIPFLPSVSWRYPHVVIRDDVLAGSPVVEGSKVPVRRLWEWHRKGVTIETLVKRYPSLGPARVLAALAFAYDNRDVIDADLARERLVVESGSVLPIGKEEKP